ncbi:MAG: ABC transporter permease [Parvibaculaceae bacterium]
MGTRYRPFTLYSLTTGLLGGKRAWLTAPLLAFLLFVFLYPIGGMLARSFKVDAVVTALPRTTAFAANWSGDGEQPAAAALAALAQDLREAKTADVASAGTVLNYFVPGARSLLIVTERRVKALPQDEAIELIAGDRRWRNGELWNAIRDVSGRYTGAYYKRIADATWENGSLKLGIYSNFYIRSFWISLVVTVLSLIVGYPMAYMISKQSARTRNMLLFLVMIPFWTSLLARTAAWLIIFQKDGPLNQLMLFIGLIAEPLDLLFSRGAVYVAMVHVMVPFVVLPVFAVMKGIPRQQMQAAASLGAHPYVGFWRVYVPQTMPAIASSALLVFTMTLGYYITPLLLGGADDQMISYSIANHTLQTGNWGLAAALASVLLIVTVLICSLYLAIIGKRGIAAS